MFPTIRAPGADRQARRRYWSSEFDKVVASVGLAENRYGIEGRNHVEPDGGVAPGHGSLMVDYIARDESNPYFTYDPAQCIVCSRCVRACEEVQGTFALTIEGRGFESRMAAGMHEPFLESECVSCGACVQACPTDALREKTVLEMGMPEHSVVTTCAYCGVGCSFKAEMKGEEVVRMVPWKDGKANRGHSCVKGRFAWGYTTHKERILNPMVREKVTDPWREVTWDEAFKHIASEFRRIQYQYGRARSAASPRRAAPTRKPISSRSWSARVSATTTSTPAPASATRRPATGSARPTAPRRARRISIRSNTPTSP